MSSGTADKVKGRIKEAAGDLTDDEKLKGEGKADEAIGKAKNAAEKTKDAAKGAAERVADKAKQAVGHDDD